MKYKTFGIIFLILWTICCIVNVAKNMEHYKIGDWIVILIVVAIPYIIYFYVKFNKIKKSNIQLSEEQAKQTTQKANDILSQAEEEYKKAELLKKEYEEKIKNVQQICDVKIKLAKEQTEEIIKNAQKVLDNTQDECNEKIQQTNELINKKIRECNDYIKFTNEKVNQIILNAKKEVPRITQQVQNTQTSNITYIETKNMTYRADGKKITDEEIPDLIRRGYEKAIENYKSSENIKFKRTEKEEELSFVFSQKYSEKISEYESAIYDSANKIGSIGKRWLDSATTEDIKDKIFLCETAIKNFEKFKKFCYGKGKGGTIYFQDMWEHCHNSNNHDFSYIDNIINEKEYLEDILFEKI